MVKSSSKGVITKKDRVIMDKEAPGLSGVYMRSLVKKMSSSKVRNPETENGFYQGGNLVKGSQGSYEVVNPQSQQPSPLLPQQHKKKVRRRLHTSRPYQEKLLNMAEARREIVTALKFHRASMKQQQQQQQEQEQEHPVRFVQQPPLQNQSYASPDLETKAEMNSWSKSPMIYPSDGAQIFTTSPDNHDQPPSFTYATVPSVSSFSFSLPSQTLGLNLNFQDFSNVSTSPFQNNPPLFTSPSSSSPALSSTTTEEIHSAAEDSHTGAFLVPQPDNLGGMAPYPAMDSEVMKEIKYMGDCYDMVWNDTMNSMTSAWWFKFSKGAGEDDHQLTQLTELPTWLNPTECYLQPHLNIACPEDPTLPWLDIGEIEGGMDGDWLA